MRISEIVTLEIKNNSTWVNYSEGILDVGVLRGIQGYQAIWQTPEAGVLTIVTRNPDVDPYANEDIRMGREIRVKANGNILFTGKITDINVDYQPKGKPPITTITAVDMIGQMALHALSDGFTEQLGGTFNIYSMFQELNGEIVGWNNPFRELGPLWAGQAVGVTPSGTNALSVAKILAQSGIQFFYADRNNDMYLYNRMDKKRDDAIKIQFDSRGGATSYREIELTDNFETLTNQLSIRNQGYNSDIVPLYTNQYSINQWGQAKKDFQVQIPQNLTIQTSSTAAVKNVIFQDAAHPSREIYSISWDGSLEPNIAATTDILDNVYVYHEVDPVDISRKYGVIGIQHQISDDNWSVKYYLKNHFVYDTNFPIPLIETNHPLGGTINDDITYSISNAADMDLTNATYSWKYETGTTGNTPGIVFSTQASPVVNYALANVGVKKITCTVTDSYGFVKTSAVLTQQVFGAAPTAVTISYTVNPQDTAIYTFTATTTEATSYTFHWGDGTTYTTTQNSATKRYTTSGNKSVYVVASNGFGTTQSGTTVINVVVPPAPAAQVGTWPLRYIILATPYQNVSGTGQLAPAFAELQLNTSNAPSGSPTTDPAVNRALIGSYETLISKEPYSTQPNGLTAIVNTNKLNNQNPGTLDIANWTYFSQNVAGALHNSIVFDMGAAYYDIDDIRIKFRNFSTTQTVNHTFNVWATDNIDSTFDFDSCLWNKIGTITSGNMSPNTTSASRGIVLESYVPSLPLNLEPNPTFTYSIGNTSENITGDVYTFSTNDFYTASYLWNFGDGNTSTLQNPVHTYATGGSKTVTLTKYDQYGNPKSSSQTFTVNRKADQLGTFGVRYIKLKQNTYSANASSGLYQDFYSPIIGDFETQSSANFVDRLFLRPIISATNTNINWWDIRTPSSDAIVTITGNQFLSTMSRPGYGSYDVTPNTSLTSFYNNSGSWTATGLQPRRASSGNTSFELVFDLGQPRYDIKTLILRRNKYLVSNAAYTQAPSYEVYFSSDNVNWTKVADITTTNYSSMPAGGSGGWTSSNISYTATLPLNI